MCKATHPKTKIMGGILIIAKLGMISHAFHCTESQSSTHIWSGGELQHMGTPYGDLIGYRSKLDNMRPEQEFVSNLFGANLGMPEEAYAYMQRLVNVDDPPHATPLGSIDYTFDHVPLTVIIVKTGTPNSFGDMKVTLKDPTGTIVVTLWRTIIQDKDFGQYIAIGFVLVREAVFWKEN
ncbi:hypothetical protein JHK87_055832 [Glycine soja]|nr:hypothetical protein JHK87_055832 [Glycine soja]